MVVKIGDATSSSKIGFVSQSRWPEGQCDPRETHLHFEAQDNADSNKTIDPASESPVFQWSVEPRCCRC